MMVPWWEIKYFDRKAGLSKFNSAMVPFKLLPELDKMDIRNGHRFQTDQFEIKIPDTTIMLHMPSNSLWIDGKPHYVEYGRRVILFQRKTVNSDGTIKNQNIYLGLMTESGHGLIIKYNVESKKHVLKKYPNGNAPDAKASVQSLPALPELEK